MNFSDDRHNFNLAIFREKYDYISELLVSKVQIDRLTDQTTCG